MHITTIIIKILRHSQLDLYGIGFLPENCRGFSRSVSVAAQIFCLQDDQSSKCKTMTKRVNN